MWKRCFISIFQKMTILGFQLDLSLDWFTRTKSALAVLPFCGWEHPSSRMAVSPYLWVPPSWKMLTGDLPMSQTPARVSPLQWTTLKCAFEWDYLWSQHLPSRRWPHSNDHENLSGASHFCYFVIFAFSDMRHIYFPSQLVLAPF